MRCIEVYGTRRQLYGARTRALVSPDQTSCRLGKRHEMLSRNDGSELRLYDAQSDPRQERDLAEDDPDTVGKMFEDYVLKDAEGSLPPL
jgi:hypothetical protein